MDVDTYEKLSVFVDRWIAGTIDLLIIESDAGFGKTSLVKEKLKGMIHLAINGHTTPLANYKQLFYHKDELVWFDDVYYLLLNELNVSIMKQLCDSQEVKTLSYYTSSELIGTVPQEFKTRSKVLITCNSLDKNDVHIQAIKDRAFYIKFRPSRAELLDKMRLVASKHVSLTDSEKDEILRVVEQHSHNISYLSLRSLMKGFQLYKYYKISGTDWKEDFLKELGLNEKLIKLNELMSKYDSDVERLKEWNWSRQTFYAYKKELDFQTNSQ